MKVGLRLLRQNGRRLAWKEVLNRPPLVGDLGTDYVDRAGSRYFKATLREPNAPVTAPLAELYEPVLVNIAPYAMGLRGYEAGGYVQEWYVEVLS